MTVGFYDYDLRLKPNKILLNLEAMKIAAYYKNQGEKIFLLDNLEDRDQYDELYVFRNVMVKNVTRGKDIQAIHSPNVSHSGLAYSNGIYIPMEQKFEEQIPHIPLYAPYIKDKIINQQLTMLQAEKLLNSHFIRLRASDYETDLSKFSRKERIYLYDYEIEKVSDWPNKLKYIREELMNSRKDLRVWVINGFKFTSFESVKKLTHVPGFYSGDVHLFSIDTYNEFQEHFKEIAPWVSSRDGIKYSFGQNINPLSNNEVIKDLCLAINKYCFTKSILKACEFVVDDQCEVSPLNKLQRDFQYWTEIRIGDETLKQHYMRKNKKCFDELSKLVSVTPYRKQFDSLCNTTKNQIKETGWYYHG